MTASSHAAAASSPRRSPAHRTRQQRRLRGQPPRRRPVTTGLTGGPQPLPRSRPRPGDRDRDRTRWSSASGSAGRRSSSPAARRSARRSTQARPGAKAARARAVPAEHEQPEFLRRPVTPGAQRERRARRSRQGRALARLTRRGGQPSSGQQRRSASPAMTSPPVHDLGIDAEIGCPQVRCRSAGIAMSRAPVAGSTLVASQRWCVRIRPAARRRSRISLSSQPNSAQGSSPSR